MSELPGLTLSKYRINQKINLYNYLGRTPSEDEKLSIGQEIIDKILERTAKNKDVNNNPFDKYSEEYIDSVDFKAYGKKKSDINMTLTGDMLSDIDIIDSTSRTITIGFNEEVNELKAANHNKGVTVPERPFFGVNEETIQVIVNKYKKEKRPDSDTKNILEYLSTQSGEDEIRMAIADLLGEEYSTYEMERLFLNGES